MWARSSCAAARLEPGAVVRAPPGVRVVRPCTACADPPSPAAPQASFRPCLTPTPPTHSLHGTCLCVGACVAAGCCVGATGLAASKPSRRRQPLAAAPERPGTARADPGEDVEAALGTEASLEAEARERRAKQQHPRPGWGARVLDSANFNTRAPQWRACAVKGTSSTRRPLTNSQTPPVSSGFFSCFVLLLLVCVGRRGTRPLSTQHRWAR